MAQVFRESHWRGVAYAAGNIYSYDAINAVIRRYETDGSGGTIVAGRAGFNGHIDGVGGEARLSSGFSLVPAGGYLYFASNQTIRRMRLSDFAVSTVAGSPGVVGALDGTGAAARFNDPQYISIDGEHLYIPDSSSHTIRRVSLTAADFGAVTTIAGTAGSAGYQNGSTSSALFSSPGCAVGAGNFVYVCDKLNHTIRVIDQTTKVVSTLAGFAGEAGHQAGVGESARLNQPFSAISIGNELLVTTFDRVVARVDMKTGRLSHFAGDVKKAEDLGIPQTLSGGIPGIQGLHYDPDFGLIANARFGVFLIE